MALMLLLVGAGHEEAVEEVMGENVWCGLMPFLPVCLVLSGSA